MKKIVALLAVLAVAAAVVLGITISRKNDLQTKLDEANSQVASLTDQVKSVQADADAAAAKAAEELAAAKAEAEEAAAKAAEELAAAKAETEEAVKNVDVLTALKNQAEEAATKAAEELESAKATIEEQANALVAFLHGEDVSVKLLAEAYIMYANTDWSAAYWNDGTETAVVPANVEVTGEGAYTVSLDFSHVENGEAAGLGLATVCIKNGEVSFPRASIKINAVRVNGEAIEVKKGYTYSDDGIETRLNLYNEWVTDIPADARSFDGSLEDASPIIVDKEAFAAVKTLEIDFELVAATDEACVKFASADWAQQYYNDGAETAIIASNAEIKGKGVYTVGLEFPTPASGLAFAAVAVKNGEQNFPGWCIEVKEVKVNGEAIKLGKGYTTSDDGIETRVNLYQEWASEIPADARRADNDLNGASAIIVDKDAFAEVKTLEVTFDYAPARAEESK